MAQRLADLDVDARVRSAGLLDAGLEAARHSVDVVKARGLDLSAHRSRTMTKAIVEEADLVLGMARSHVREAVLAAPDAWPKTFTLKELVRLGDKVGPRQPGQPLEEWLARAGEGRNQAALLGASPTDDVADPIGHPRPVYEKLVAELDDLLERLVKLVWGESGA